MISRAVVCSIYKAGLYYRLSDEDAEVSMCRKDESASIANQKNLIKDFLKDKEDIVVEKEYTDDGVSGSSFSRPAFNALMEDAEAGVINCVVVKDLSRFGREYIDAGNLLEKVFPALGVRFIAVNDNVDTKYGMDTLTVSLKNIMNDAYCRDISIKTRSNLAVKRNHGQFIGAFAMYGYEKDPRDKNHLVVDEYAGDVVAKIFLWKIQGMSCNGIADRLNQLGVLSPYEYKINNGMLYTSNFKMHEKALWSAVAVRSILENRVYVGTLVQGKWTSPNHKVKKKVMRDERKWAVIENAHEAIVSERDFNLVQKSLLLDTRTPKGEEVCYPLSGVMVCADCGANMVRKPVRSGEYTYAYYECQEYKSSKRRRCSCHSIREDKVEKIVLEAIRCQIDLVIRMDECMKHLDLTMLTELDRKRLERQKRVYEADIVKYGELVKKCYEDLYEGVISKDDYIAFKEEFELKKMAAHKGLAEVELEMRRVEDKTSVHYKWVEHFLEYKNVDELNRAMVLELVDSIVVKDKNHVEITMAFQDEFEVAYGELSALGEAAGEGQRLQAVMPEGGGICGEEE